MTKETGWRTLMPTPGKWEEDFAEAQGAFRDIATTVFGEKAGEEIAHEASIEGYSMNATERTKITHKIIDAAKAALSGTSRNVAKIFSGIKNIFESACNKIAAFIKADRHNKVALIRATCDMAIKGAKVAAKRAVEMMAQAARQLGTGILGVAEATLAAPSHAVTTIRKKMSSAGRTISHYATHYGNIALNKLKRGRQ